MKLLREILVVVGAATLLAGCGQPVCIAGIGSCDAYKLNPGGATAGSRVDYKLTLNPPAPNFNDKATASLTSNSTKPLTAACEWNASGPGSVGGDVQPDATPQVANALCTMGFTANTRGEVIIQVKEKNSGVSSQVRITVR